MADETSERETVQQLAAKLTEIGGPQWRLKGTAYDPDFEDAETTAQDEDEAADELREACDSDVDGGVRWL